MSELYAPMYVSAVDHERGSVTFSDGYAPEVFDGGIAHNLYRYLVMQGAQPPVEDCWPLHGGRRHGLDAVAAQFYASTPPRAEEF